VAEPIYSMMCCSKLILNQIAPSSWQCLVFKGLFGINSPRFLNLVSHSMHCESLNKDVNLVDENPIQHITILGDHR
jgi:hypothetical protein